MIKIIVDGRDGGVDLYSPLEAQEYLGISVGTLGRWRREGWLVGSLVGRGYLYTREQLDDCLIAQGHDRRNINVEVIHG